MHHLSLSIDGHLGYVRVLASVNSVETHMGVQMGFSQRAVFLSSVYILRRGLAVS